ncbi:MAG: UDP-N-acetylmuramoyl-L-alanine--D-glutamate ligase [Candidatus Nealsonbacteria bacterium]
MKLEELKNKKIIILGFAREGMDTFLFLRKVFPGQILGVGDSCQLKELGKKAQKLIKEDKNIDVFLGKDYLKSLSRYDIIIKSPGIKPKTIAPFVKKQQITSQTAIFFNNYPGNVVGVTGTKGKSTTASLIYRVLKAGGLDADLIGNIGKPVLSSLSRKKRKDVYVYELSSHQLQYLKTSPHIAVLLNIYPEHLDYYKNFKEYVRAKFNITLYQKKGDYLIYNAQDKIIRKIVKKSKIELPSTGAKMKMKFSSPASRKIKIKGEYYQLDKEAAKAVGRIFKIPEKVILRAINSFKGLPHRLELVGTFDGITFYNDALATIPEATIAAIKFLGNKVETIMLGGFNRNIDFKILAKEVLKSKIKTVILFPETGKRIWKDILMEAKGSRLPRSFSAENMEDAVRTAYSKTKKGKICLLSTASASFNMFKDYKEKGNAFKKYVKRFASKKIGRSS